MRRDVAPNAAGLFFVALSTLLLEILDSRLLSVLIWYHPSFFAVSVAMLAMAGGAVFVFLGGDRFHGSAGAKRLVRYSPAMALAIPLSHVVNLCVPVPALYLSLLVWIVVLAPRPFSAASWLRR